MRDTAPEGVRQPDNGNLGGSSDLAMRLARCVIHGSPYASKQRVNEWCDRRPLCQYNQASQEKHDEDDGCQPELLSFLHEAPKVYQ